MPRKKSSKSAFAATMLSVLCLISSCAENKEIPAGTTLESSDKSKVSAESKPCAGATEVAPTSDIEIPDESTVAKQPDTIVVKNGDRDVVFRMFRDKKGGGSVVDDSDKTLVKFTEEPDQKKGQKLVRVENAPGKVSCFVRVAGLNIIKIEDEKNQDLFTLKFENSGQFRLKDPHDKVLYKLKEEPGLLVVEQGEEGKPVCKVKVKDNRIVLKADGAKLALFTRAEVPPVVLACFAMNELSKEQQYGLAYSLMFLRY